MKRKILAAWVVSLGITGMGHTAASAGVPASRPDDVPVTFTGGHDTEPADHGRPVMLIAYALGVPTEVFRDAFTHVHPAQNRGGPTPDEARANKRELLSRLAKYGVTNERLDEVSNFYRYRPQDGQLWKHKDAVAFATLKNGIPTSIRIEDMGYGYNTPPTITIAGVTGATAVPTLRFDKDFQRNGRIEMITLAAPTTAP